MQNMSRTQKKLWIAAALAVTFVIAALCMPAQAYAKSYSMPKVDIEAEAATDGSLHAVEQRVFDFDGSFTAVWWTFDGLPSNAKLEINGVSLTSLDGSGAPIGEAVALEPTSFNLSWRDAGGPGNTSYSVDSPLDTVYVFFNVSDEKLLVTLDYTIVNGVQAYKDVGEVYWKYIGDQWAEASGDVTMNLTLPVPQGEAVVAGDNVRAWGHGPLDGNLTINDDGSVTYTVPHVSAGQFAEARVAFPTEWLTDITDEAALIHKDQTRLDQILSEEQVWADQANRTRVLSLVFVIACILIAVALLIWAIRAYFKHGKEHNPEFKDQYWRDVPSPQDHPVLMARLWRWNKESNDDFTATLMNLSHLGAISINKGSYQESGVFRPKTIDDYYLTRNHAVAATLTNPIDKKALDFLFNTIAGGQDSLWFASIQQYGKDNPQRFMDEMKAWQGVVTAEMNKRDFFEAKGKRLQMTMATVAILFIIVGVGSALILENFIPLIFIVPVSIAVLVIANYMPRRSQEGCTLDAKCKALRNWLKDFSALDERPPTDVKVWGVFMVYAFMFGIAKEVIKALEMKVPELFQQDATGMYPSYVPWYFWYTTSHGSAGVMPSAADLFQTSLSNTVSTAQAAISAASGGSSSGGGFGGGFSGGGGGGFGGGGGAR